MLFHVQGRSPYAAGRKNGVFLDVDPDTVDNSREFRATGYSVADGTAWRLWTAPDTRPLRERRVMAQKIAPGWNDIHTAVAL